MPDSETEPCKMFIDRASVHTGNASSRTIFVPDQDYSAPLLKVERPVSDRFLNSLDLV